MVSILIATRNEEKDLPECLASVSWSDDVHVYDSWSTDGPAEIAKRAGARVTVAPKGSSGVMFGGDESAHRNWALQNIEFKYSWILLMDADERGTAALQAEIAEVVTRETDIVAYRIRRRDIFWNTWLRHVQVTAWYLRLFRPDCVRYERLINPVSVASGPIGYLQEPFDHFPFSKGITHWIERHNSYSSLEARQIQKNRDQGEKFSFLMAIAGRDASVRKFHQKELFYRLPGRPVIKFVTLYLLKGGVLDGRAGFWYSVLQSIYECMIVLKEKELRRERD